MKEKNTSSALKSRLGLNCLLLWNRIPTDDTILPSPVILAANLDVSSKNPMGERYGNPSDTQSGSRIDTDGCFRYIIKRVGTLSLLSESLTASGVNDLYGWVDQNSYSSLGRLFLEPTWVVEDVEFFAKNGITANVYYKENMQEQDIASMISFEKKEYVANDNPSVYRMDGNQLRFPVLDGFRNSAFWSVLMISQSSTGAVFVTKSKSSSGDPQLDNEWLESRIGKDSMALLKNSNTTVVY